jgi:hypothetical protein
MSRDATIELTFAGDERKFTLAYVNLLALQDACDAGYLEIYDRLANNRARAEDVFETLRIGLIGAGVDAKIAKRWVEQNLIPLAASRMAAQLVLGGCIAGDPREQVGKEEAATDETEANAFPPPPSTSSPEPLDAQLTNLSA